MALNRVMLAGIVEEEPSFIFLSEKSSFGIRISLLINRPELDRVETISFLILDDELITQAMDEIHKGDYILVKSAKVRTISCEIEQTVSCPYCGQEHELRAHSEKTEIECLTYRKLPACSLKESVGINRVVIMGNICSDMIFRPGKMGAKSFTKYKLAINRSKIDETEEQKSDYPYLVSFGREADYAHEFLGRSSFILIEGSVQQRHIRKKNNLICSGCKQISAPLSSRDVCEIIVAQVYSLMKEEHDEEVEDEKGKI